MLTKLEEQKLKELLHQMQTHPANHPHINIQNQLRDEKGKFLPKESSLGTKVAFPLQLDKKKKIVKVNGSNNSYLIKDRRFSDGEIDTLIVLIIIGIFAIIF